ncbi:hypothetical protein N9I12_03865 [Gammaproteobacteria bacterium]|nr:hypothetical protein [Gammaproteobacteria bacterium]
MKRILSIVCRLCQNKSNLFFKGNQMIKMTITTFLFLISFLTLAAHVEPVQTKTGEQEIVDIISSIKYGWENGDGTPFRETFLDFKGARYIESGGQN